MSLHDASRLATLAPDKIGGYDSKCRRRNCLALKLPSMGLMSVKVLPALFLAAVLLLGNAPRLLAQERHIATYSGVSGTLGPQWVSVDRRLFEKYGLKVEWVFMSGAVRGIQALISGGTNYYTGDPVPALSASLQGGDVVSIGTMLNRIPGSLLARKEIREPADLRGKKIGVASFGGGTELAVILAFRKWRMALESVSMIQSGAASDRLVALLKGGIDASPLSPPHSFEATQRGLNVLIDFNELEAFPQRVLVVRRSFLEKNRDSVKRFVKAYSEAVFQFNNDKKLGIATYSKWLNEKNPKIQDETYNYFRGMLGYPPRLIRSEGLHIGVQMIAQRLGRTTTAPSIEQFFDESLVDELEKEGFFNSLTVK
jgi:ABC-type nitrate/sulfonate/bicarbonate transport system substrate-binding protein